MAFRGPGAGDLAFPFKLWPVLNKPANTVDYHTMTTSWYKNLSLTSTVIGTVQLLVFFCVRAPTEVVNSPVCFPVAGFYAPRVFALWRVVI